MGHGGVGHCEVIQPASGGSRYSIANMRCAAAYTHKHFTRASRTHKVVSHFRSAQYHGHTNLHGVLRSFFPAAAAVSAAKVGPPYSQQRATCPLLRWGPRRDSRDSFFSCNVTAFSGMI